MSRQSNIQGDYLSYGLVSLLVAFLTGIYMYPITNNTNGDGEDFFLKDITFLELIPFVTRFTMPTFVKI